MKKKFLSKEREIELGYLIKNYYKEKEKKGDNADPRIIALGEKAIEEMIANNYLLVTKIAYNFKKKYPYSSDIEDLISMGMIGMMKAIQKYDPDRGNKFSTMAYNWISQSITRTCNETSRMIRLPENKLYEMINITKREKELEEHYHHNTIQKIILQEFDISPTTLQHLRSVSSNIFSLDSFYTSSHNGEEFSVSDVIDKYVSTQENKSIEDTVSYNIAHEEFEKILLSLPRMNREVIQAYSHYYVENTVPLTPNEVKIKYSLTDKDYKKVIRVTLKKLRQIMEENNLQREDFF